MQWGTRTFQKGLLLQGRLSCCPQLRSQCPELLPRLVLMQPLPPGLGEGAGPAERGQPVGRWLRIQAWQQEATDNPWQLQDAACGGSAPSKHLTPGRRGHFSRIHLCPVAPTPWQDRTPAGGRCAPPSKSSSVASCAFCENCGLLVAAGRTADSPHQLAL